MIGCKEKQKSHFTVDDLRLFNNYINTQEEKLKEKYQVDKIYTPKDELPILNGIMKRNIEVLKEALN